MRDLGLGGVCIDPVNVELEDSLKKNAFHSIKLRLDKIGKVFLSARVVRNENECVGLRFLTIPQGDLIKIWQFIRDEIDNSKTCPYCNTRFDGHQGQCPFCSWKLNFKDKDYLIY